MSYETQLKKLKDIMAQFVGFTGIKLPDDVIAKLKELSEKETDPMPKVIYETMFRNQELAVKLNRPSCQDTGVLQFWVKSRSIFRFIIAEAPLHFCELVITWNLMVEASAHSEGTPVISERILPRLLICVSAQRFSSAFSHAVSSSIPALERSADVTFAE